MTRIFTLAGSTALGGALMASPVLAELTAAEVWADQKGYYELSGYTVTATEAADGDVLTVTDLTLTIPMPDEALTVALTVPEFTYTTQPDGTVVFAMPSSVPIVMDVTPDADAPVRIGMSLDSTKLGSVISGTIDDMTKTFDGDNLVLKLTEVTVEGANIVPGIVDLRLSAAQFDGESTILRAGNRAMTQALALGDVSYVVKVQDPASNEGGSATGNLADVSLGADFAMPLDFDPNDPAAVFGPDFTLDATFSAGAGNLDFDVVADGAAMTGAMSSTASRQSFTMGGGAFGFAVEGEGNTVALQGGELPFPVEFAMERSRLAMTMPLVKSDESQPVALGLTLGNFTMADLLWSIFDPTSQLPRDPVTIDIDLEGAVKVLVDLFDEDQVAAMERGEVIPGEAESLTLKTLLIDAVGARLTGSGAFTFDNTDLQTYDGFPKPVGALDLQLDGANALIDTLIAMGILPQEQAMGARMMMSMFAVPAGEDSLKSRIEMNEQGQVLANGQRLR